MQLQVNWSRRAMQYGSYTLLLSLLLYSHTPPATEFSHRLHTLKMMGCPLWASACDSFLFFSSFFLFWMQKNPWMMFGKSTRRGRGMAQEEHLYTLVQIQMKAGIFFFLWMMWCYQHDISLLKKKKKGLLNRSCVWDEVREERLWMMCSRAPDPSIVNMLGSSHSHWPLWVCGWRGEDVTWCRYYSVSLSKCVTSICISTCSCWIGWSCGKISLWSCRFLLNWREFAVVQSYISFRVLCS